MNCVPTVVAPRQRGIAGSVRGPRAFEVDLRVNMRDKCSTTNEIKVITAGLDG